MNEIWSKIYILVFIYSARNCCKILMKIDFSWACFRKILKYQIRWKSLQWERSCFIRTDMTKLTVVFFFHKFAKPHISFNKNQTCDFSFFFINVYLNPAATPCLKQIDDLLHLLSHPTYRTEKRVAAKPSVSTLRHFVPPIH